MLVRILIDGESPDIGPLIKGAERIICPESLAMLLIKGGIAEEIKPSASLKTGSAKQSHKQTGETPVPPKEVKENG